MSSIEKPNTLGVAPSLSEQLSAVSSRLSAERSVLSRILEVEADQEVRMELGAALVRLGEATQRLESISARSMPAEIEDSSKELTAAQEVVKWYSWNPQRAERFGEVLAFFSPLAVGEGVTASIAARRLPWLQGLQSELAQREAETYLRNAAKVGVLAPGEQTQGDVHYSLTTEAREWIEADVFREKFGIASKGGSK